MINCYTRKLGRNAGPGPKATNEKQYEGNGLAKEEFTLIEQMVRPMEGMMNREKALAVFENYKIRRAYDEKSDTWFFSVVDIIGALIQQPDYQAARNYWKVLKNRLKKEGSQTVTNCNRLKRSGVESNQGVTKCNRLEWSSAEGTQSVSNCLQLKKAGVQF